MPGDVREQQIEVRATGVKSQVRVFVRAVVDHETAHLLSPITLTASAGDASAGWLQTGTPGSVFAYPTQVATFASDGSTVLNLQLSVPTSVGNELADANKTIRWEITAEDDGEKIPVQSAGSKKPGLLGLVATGDSTLTLLLVLLTLAIIAFIAALLFVPEEQALGPSSKRNALPGGGHEVPCSTVLRKTEATLSGLLCVRNSR